MTSELFRFRTVLQLLMVATLGLLASCVRPSDYGVSVTSPALAAFVTALGSVEGTYKDVGSPITRVTFQLIRYGDGKAWDGATWGGSGDVNLATTLNAESHTWVSSATLPTSGALEDGYYNVVALADFQDGKQERADAVFSVGVTPPPVTPAMYAWGENESWQLGVGNTSATAIPLPVNMRGALEGKIVVAVAAGGYHSLALSSEGKVYAWGYGAESQLGTGSFVNQLFPVPVSTGPSSALAGKTIVAVGAGNRHSLAVDDAGKVYAWGSNSEGEIGDNTIGGNVLLPVLVGGALTGKHVIAVEAGTGYSLALTKTGEVYAWGVNAQGQLGNGTTTRSQVPVLVSGFSGKVVTAIAAGVGSHSLAITSDGKVYAWGLNTDGQLGNNSASNSNVPVLAGGGLTGKVATAIACGSYHSLAVADGKVYSWGSAYDGQLGLGGNPPDGSGSDPDVLIPTEVGGALVGKTVVTVGVGTAFSFVTTEDSKAYAWGGNVWGQLAQASSTGSRVPALSDLSAALDGGRVILGIASGPAFTIALTGFKPLLAPQMVVEANVNGAISRVESGGTLDFGTDVVGAYNQIILKVGNEGTSDLTGISATLDGTNQYQFYRNVQDTRVAPGGSGTVIAAYLPNVAGTHTATLHIHSNAGTFDLVLKGKSYVGGVLDSTFATPALTSTVRTTAVLPDDKVLIGGEFTTVGGTARSYLARLLPNGTLDASFTLGTNDPVSSIAVQPDGKILIGGSFNLVGGVGHSRIARLNADGTLDGSFDPGVGTGEVLGIALQKDGKIIIVGSFSDVGGSGKSRIARLNTDGTVDTDFTATVSHAVQCVAIQDDNDIVIGGSFTTVGGAAHLGLARLRANGDVDASYNPQINDGEVRCIVSDTEYRVIIGGSFTTVNSAPRTSLVRLDWDGTLEEGYLAFNVAMNGPVNTLAVQADGSIYFGGAFTTVQGQPRNNVGRLNSRSDVVDFYINPNVNGPVSSLGLQKDGKVLVAGAFTQVGSQTSARLARLTNKAAVDRITVTSPTSLDWVRSGGAPDLRQISFDVSGDGGTTWTSLGTIYRSWYGSITMAGLDLPFPGQIRMRGYAAGGFNGGSSTLIESITSYGGQPQMSITSDGSYTYPGGSSSTQDFGVVATGSGVRSVTFTLTNTGTGDLKNLNTSLIVGPAAPSFRITQPAATSVPAGGSTNMVVSFAPRVQGSVAISPATVLKILSNDPSGSVVQIGLTGTGGVDTANWKIQNNQVGVADDADTDGDGISTLMENALGGNPNVASGVGITVTPPGAAVGGGGSGFAPPPGDLTFTFNYTRNKLALGDLVFQVEWSDTLGTNDWHTDGVMEQVVGETGQQQQVTATLPAGSGGRRFARLKVTRP